MKKVVLILSFILVSLVSLAQRQRTTAVFDADTTTLAKSGFYGIGVRDFQPWILDWRTNT
ncbi:MAG: hypothetical protein IPO04_18220 [Cytophagaceae bacterium]|nr:hypothetical protein [Cytophagaceae bacterium]